MKLRQKLKRKLIKTGCTMCKKKILKHKFLKNKKKILKLSSNLCKKHEKIRQNYVNLKTKSLNVYR